MLELAGLSLTPVRVTAHADGGGVEFYAHGAIVITVARGAIVASDTEALIEVVEDRLREVAPLTIFHDWQAVTGYESASRVRLTAWSSSAPRGSLGPIHVLFRSRLVAMGVATAALALRVVGLSINSHATRANFTRALHAALGGEAERRREARERGSPS